MHHVQIAEHIERRDAHRVAERTVIVDGIRRRLREIVCNRSAERICFHASGKPVRFTLEARVLATVAFHEFDLEPERVLRGILDLHQGKAVARHELGLERKILQLVKIVFAFRIAEFCVSPCRKKFLNRALPLFGIFPVESEQRVVDCRARLDAGANHVRIERVDECAGERTVLEKCTGTVSEGLAVGSKVAVGATLREEESLQGLGYTRSTLPCTTFRVKNSRLTHAERPSSYAHRYDACLQQPPRSQVHVPNRSAHP